MRGGGPKIKGIKLTFRASYIQATVGCKEKRYAHMNKRSLNFRDIPKRLLAIMVGFEKGRSLEM